VNRGAWPSRRGLRASLSDDGREMKDAFAESGVSFDGREREGFIAVDSLGKYAPGDLLRNDDPGGGRIRGL
jgi:hypothetical protein